MGHTGCRIYRSSPLIVSSRQGAVENLKIDSTVTVLTELIGVFSWQLLRIYLMIARSKKKANLYRQVWVRPGGTDKEIGAIRRDLEQVPAMHRDFVRFVSISLSVRFEDLTYSI